MLNIPKENVKAFVAIVVGLAVLIISSIIIDINFIHKSVFHKAEPDMTRYSNTPESKVEENKYNIASEQRRILYYTDEIMDMINKKEFEKLYSILDEGYRKNYVASVDVLKKYMERLGDEEYTLVYNNYYKEGNMFLIEARFDKTSLTREDIINGISYPTDTLCIRELEKGKYTVAFNGFIDKKILNKESSNGLVRVKVKEMIINADSTEILINIENLTDEKITIYDDRLDIYIAHNGAFQYVNPNTILRELKAKERLTYRITFRNMYSNNSAPKTLRFNRVYGSDGKFKTLKFDL